MVSLTNVLAFEHISKCGAIFPPNIWSSWHTITASLVTNESRSY